MRENCCGNFVPSETLLTALGLTSQEEEAYRCLVSHAELNAAGLAEAMQVSKAAADKLLKQLEVLGLASRSSPRARVFAPTSPQIAVEALIVKRQEELGRARSAAAALEEEFRRAQPAMSGGEFEVLASYRAVAERVAAIQASATTEILAFDRLPYVVPLKENTAQADAALRGVAHRCVYDRAALDEPGRMQDILRAKSWGVDSRVHSALPTKLLIVDRKVALLGAATNPDAPLDRVVLVRTSVILDALISLREIYWEHSVPITGQGVREAESDPEEELLIGLLLAGMKVGAIARQLEIAESTVERRIKRLLENLDATTRFQAGYQLGRSKIGWSSDQHRAP